MLTSILTRSLTAAFAPSALAFELALRAPQVAQTSALRRIVRELAPARRHRALRGVRTLRDLQSAAPVSAYEDYAADLGDAAAGAPRVMCASPIVRFERSGGSTAAQKLLPQTRPFLAEMNRALHPWLFDLYARAPGVARGCAYWSISPIGQKSARTAGGIPIGADDDASYFPAPVRALLARVLAVPSSLARIPDVDECRYATLKALLARDDLALVSVWSPTFLLLLLDALDARRADLVRDLSRAHPARAQLLERTTDVRALWPALALVSMWTDGASAAFVDAVTRRTGGVPIQPKGLLAVEGTVSIPWRGRHPLAVRSHVLEFVDERAPEARPRFAHELEIGGTYEVLLTTSAGLVRYRLRDRVKVVGFVEATPDVRFVGRAGVVSDLVGEKLSLERVEAVLADVVADPRVSFVMLAPSTAPRGYVLYLDRIDTARSNPATLDRIAARVEERLCEGHPYRYARELGQLCAVRARRVVDGAHWYEAGCVRRGQRAGDIKATRLHLATDWESTLAPP